MPKRPSIENIGITYNSGPDVRETNAQRLFSSIWEHSHLCQEFFIMHFKLNSNSTYLNTDNHQGIQYFQDRNPHSGNDPRFLGFARENDKLSMKKPWSFIFDFDGSQINFISQSHFKFTKQKLH